MQASKDRKKLTIEFIGGPFDGYLQRCSSSRERLPGDVVWLVSSDSFCQVNFPHPLEPSSGGTLTSVALYGLDTSSEPPCYRHVGSVSTTCLQTLLRNLSPKLNGQYPLD
jgi:hypothetical protein